MKRKNIFNETRRRTSQGLRGNSFLVKLILLTELQTFPSKQIRRGIFTQLWKIGSFLVIKFTWSRCIALWQVLLKLFINLALLFLSSHEIPSNYLSSHLHAPSFDKTPKGMLAHSRTARESLALNNKYGIIHAYIIIHDAWYTKCLVSSVNWISGKNMLNSRHVLLHLSSAISGHKQRALVCKLFYLDYNSCWW